MSSEEVGSSAISNSWLSDQGAGGRNPLLLANAEIEHPLIEQFFNVESSRHLPCRLRQVRRPQTRPSSLVKTTGQSDVVDDIQIWDQIEHLKDEDDMLSAKRVPLRSGEQPQILAERLDHAGLSRQHARHHAEERRLTTAARSVQKDLFSLAYFELADLERVPASSVGEPNILELNRELHLGREAVYSFNSCTEVPIIVKATSP